MAKNPLVQNMPSRRYDTMYRAQKDGLKNPSIGVTQGGSSRKHNRGAKVAATDASVKPTRKK